MAGIADELKRIPMSEALAATLMRAADYARAQTQGEVALEHLLLALTEDEDAAQVLSASHVDSALLKADVSLYLGGLEFQGAGSRPGHMTLATDLKRILEAAAAAASQGRRREINGAIVLAAIVGDGRSSAAHMLRAQGLTFEEAIKALQRALASPAKAGVAASAPVLREPSPLPELEARADSAQPEAEDIIATARARVQTRAAPGMPAFAARTDPVSEPPPAELVIGKATAESAAPRGRSSKGPGAKNLGSGSDMRGLGRVAPTREEAAVAVWPPPVRSSLEPSPELGPLAEVGGQNAFLQQRSGAPTEADYVREPGSNDHGAGHEIGQLPYEARDHRAFERDPIGASFQPSDVTDRAGLRDPQVEPGPTFERGFPLHNTMPPHDGESSPFPAGRGFVETGSQHAPPRTLSPPVAVRSPVLAGGASNTRWPAPVAPAWRDQPATPAFHPDFELAPPPLPGQRPFQVPNALVPPPLPAPGLENADHQDAYAGSWSQAHPGHALADREADLGASDRFGPSVGDAEPRWPHSEPYALSADTYQPAELPNANDFAAWPQQEPSPEWQSEAFQPEAFQPEAYQHGPIDDNATGPPQLPVAPRPVKRRKSIERTTSARMIETVPRRLRKGVAMPIEIRLENSEFRSLADGLQGEDSTTRPATLAAALSVALSAPDGAFNIVLVSPQTQWLDVTGNPSMQDFASWRWMVTPLSRGKKQLHLGMAMRTLVADGTPTVTTLPEQTVQVRVSLNYVRGFLRLLGWLGLVVSGWLLAKYADPFVKPLLAEVMKFGS